MRTDFARVLLLSQTGEYLQPNNLLNRHLIGSHMFAGRRVKVGADILSPVKFYQFPEPASTYRPMPMLGNLSQAAQVKKKRERKKERKKTYWQETWYKQ